MPELSPELLTSLAALAALLSAGASLAVSGHAVLHKEHSRAVAGWLGLVWLAPALGAVLYLLFGINRVRRKAAELRGERVMQEPDPPPGGLPEALAPLVHLVRQVSRRRLERGNRVELLRDGDVAYPAMLAAIDGAKRTVGLSMFIFDADPAGDRFVQALSAAVKRGVEVRVLLDGLGIQYSFPRSAARRLRRAGVPTALFLWSWNPARMAYLNLRSHRKLLLVDGRTAYTGGMNIRQGHVLEAAPPHPTRDLMVELEGPTVAQLTDVFCEDWSFTTGEELGGHWRPEQQPVGDLLARALPDGPDEDFGVAAWTFAGALAVARHSVRIMTPYFLPEEDLELALMTAALRGVQVDVVVQAESNLRYLNRAMYAELGPLVKRGVRMWLSPGPFDHTKLMVVDETWVCVGSANWDARSLRLNFELNLEIYGRELARQAAALVDEARDRAEPITTEMLEARPRWQQLIDGSLRLFKPYL